MEEKGGHWVCFSKAKPGECIMNEHPLSVLITSLICIDALIECVCVCVCICSLWRLFFKTKHQIHI